MLSTWEMLTLWRISQSSQLSNSTAIWEYDPIRADNRVLGGSLDVIAAIRTLAIKVRFFYLSNVSLSHGF